MRKSSLDLPLSYHLDFRIKLSKGYSWFIQRQLFYLGTRLHQVSQKTSLIGITMVWQYSDWKIEVSSSYAVLGVMHSLFQIHKSSNWITLDKLDSHLDCTLKSSQNNNSCGVLINLVLSAYINLIKTSFWKLHLSVNHTYLLPASPEAPGKILSRRILFTLRKQFFF